MQSLRTMARSISCCETTRSQPSRGARFISVAQEVAGQLDHLPPRKSQATTLGCSQYR